MRSRWIRHGRRVCSASGGLFSLQLPLYLTAARATMLPPSASGNCQIQPGGTAIHVLVYVATTSHHKTHGCTYSNPRGQGTPDGDLSVRRWCYACCAADQ